MAADDQVPALTRDNVREDAGEILSALEASPPHQGEFEDKVPLLCRFGRPIKPDWGLIFPGFSIGQEYPRQMHDRRCEERRKMPAP